MIEGDIHRPIQSGAFSPDGRCLALDFNDGTVVEFELATARARRIFGKELPPPLRGDERRNFVPSALMGFDGPQSGPRLAYSPDNKSLVHAGPDQVIRLWDSATGLELATFRGHNAPLLAVAFAPDGKSVASAGWDTTALVWDVSKWARPIAPIMKLEFGELAANWDLIAGDDAPKAFDAIIALSRSPTETVAFIEQRLKPASPAELQRIDRLIGQLDSAEFKVRDEASNELRKIGDRATYALDKALAGNPSLETRRRLEALRNQSDPTSMNLTGDRLLAYRAVEVLERIDTPEARRLLTAYANGAPGSLLTTSAASALKK
jgi:hypothetical protein